VIFVADLSLWKGGGDARHDKRALRFELIMGHPVLLGTL
jgi:hypothetical protein